MVNTEDSKRFTNLGWLTFNSMKQLLGRTGVTWGNLQTLTEFDNAHLDESCVIIKTIRNNLVS